MTVPVIGCIAANRFRTRRMFSMVNYSGAGASAVPIYEVCLFKPDGRGLIDVLSVLAVDDAHAMALGVRYAQMHPVVEVWRRTEQIWRTKKPRQGDARS